MAKLKGSTYLPHIFSKFSSNFLQLFQMTKMKCFHDRSTNVCNNTVKVKAAFCSNEFLLRQKCEKCVIFWLHGFCVNQPCTCCGNVLETSHIWHLVCVCVRMNFSAICRLAPCLWDMGISKHKRRNATTRPVHLNSTGLFLQKQGVRRWNEAIFSCSTKASNSFTQNARQIETGRSGKREAKKRLYKLQPLRQQKAIAIWPETRLNMGTAYMKQKGTHVTTIHWGYHFEAPRSSGASSSCLLHAPSCKDKASDNTKG